MAVLTRVLVLVHEVCPPPLVFDDLASGELSNPTACFLLRTFGKRQHFCENKANLAATIADACESDAAGAPISGLLSAPFLFTKRRYWPKKIAGVPRVKR